MAEVGNEQQLRIYWLHVIGYLQQESGWPYVWSSQQGRESCVDIASLFTLCESMEFA